MVIKLYQNASPNNRIGKTLNQETSYNGSLRDSSKILRPTIMIEASNLTGFNYAYIQEFNRFYYIKDIESYRDGLWILTLEVDVLETYKNQIGNLECIIEATEQYKANDYLSNSDSWVSTVKAKTNIVNFSNGLLDDGEYILITAGG